MLLQQTQLLSVWLPPTLGSRTIHFGPLDSVIVIPYSCKYVARLHNAIYNADIGSIILDEYV